jgi:pimeloyl-ACP methyl ester carboxylesterase
MQLALTESEGPGLPILFLHGTASSRAAFARQFSSPLARQHRLLALDLPGHGESSDAIDPAAYSLRALTDTVAQFIATLNLRRLVICGWSLGGHIAMELIGHPAIAGVMVIGAPPLSKGPLGVLRAFQPSWDMLLASKENFSERDVNRFYGLCFGRGGSSELMAAVRRADGRVRPALSNSIMRGEMVDERRVVETSRVPVAIVNGVAEPFVRLAYLDGLSRGSLWHGEPLLVADAGHAPFWDQPDTFNQLLADFADEAAMEKRERQVG